MTDRLYYRDAYLTEFSARVQSRSPDGLRVVLDRTAFYPTSGGQQHDTGMLNNVRVTDVIDEIENIVHVLEAPLDGDAISGRVDWERRHDHMQQHTGQHLLSAVFEDLFGFRTASVHFGAVSSSIDLETAALTRAQTLDAEARANAAVMENRAVTVSFEDAATAANLRKPPERDGEVRIVTIAGIDRSACGGTHLRSTAEIGPVLLRRQDRMHGNVRIDFLCGQRALGEARADFEVLAATSASFGVASGEVATRAARLVGELRESERLNRQLVAELAEFRVARLYSDARPDAQGRRWIIEILDSGSLDDLRPVAQAAMTLGRAAFIGVVREPAQLMLASSEDSGINAGSVLKAALSELGGRGGGSARLAQGSIAADALDQLIVRVQSS